MVVIPKPRFGPKLWALEARSGIEPLYAALQAAAVSIKSGIYALLPLFKPPTLILAIRLRLEYARRPASRTPTRT